MALRIVDEVKQTGVTAEELSKAKKIILSHHLGTLTTMRGQASDIGSSWLLTRNLNFSRECLDAVQKVTLEDIKRVAIRQGMLTLRQDGLLKIQQGITTIEEVLRETSAAE